MVHGHYKFLISVDIVRMADAQGDVLSAAGIDIFPFGQRIAFDPPFVRAVG